MNIGGGRRLEATKFIGGVLILVSKMVGGLEHVFPIQLGIITPTDFHIFQRGWNRQPENMCSTFSECSPMENHPLTLRILRANPGIATAAHVLHDEWNSLRENPRGTLVFACFYHKVSQFPASFALVSKSNLQLFFWEDILHLGYIAHL